MPDAKEYSYSRESLPQDLEAYVREATGMSQAAFVSRRPHPFLLFARSALWDKSLLMEASMSSSGGRETSIVRFDIPSGGMAFLSPLKKRSSGPKDPGVVLGRNVTGNDLIVPVASISGRQAMFSAKTNGAWQVTDLASTNGTYLNEARLEAHEPVDLPDGDYLRLGGNLIAWFLSPEKLWQVAQDRAALLQLTDL